MRLTRILNFYSLSISQGRPFPFLSHNHTATPRSKQPWDNTRETTTPGTWNQTLTHSMTCCCPTADAIRTWRINMALLQISRRQALFEGVTHSLKRVVTRRSFCSSCTLHRSVQNQPVCPGKTCIRTQNTFSMLMCVRIQTVQL